MCECWYAGEGGTAIFAEPLYALRPTPLGSHAPTRAKKIRMQVIVVWPLLRTGTLCPAFLFHIVYFRPILFFFKYFIP